MSKKKITRGRNSPQTMCSFRAPKSIHNFLLSKGINISAVCRSALENALKSSSSKKPHLTTHTFRLSRDLAKKISKSGININEVCRKSLESLFSKLKSKG